MSLEIALPIVLKFEGGFSDDPDDPGGRTNYGITQAEYDAVYGAGRDVLDITPAEVQYIYDTQYWKLGLCDILNAISDKLSLIHFDTCVNCGVTTAIRILQKAVG